MSATRTDFKGHYCKAAKTSIVRTATGNIAPAKKFADLHALLASWCPTRRCNRSIPDSL